VRLIIRAAFIALQRLIIITAADSVSLISYRSLIPARIEDQINRQGMIFDDRAWYAFSPFASTGSVEWVVVYYLPLTRRIERASNCGILRCQRQEYLN